MTQDTRSPVQPLVTGDLGGLARGGTLNLFGGGFAAAAGLALIAIASRALGPGGVGALMSAIAIFNVAMSLALFGAHTGLVRFISHAIALDRANDVHRYLFVGLAPVAVMGTLTGVAMLAWAEPAAAFFASPDRAGEVAAYTRVFAVVVPFAALHAVASSATRGFGTMKPSVAVEQIFKPASQVLLVALALAMGLSPTLLGMAWSLPLALGLIALAPWLRRLVNAARATSAAPPARGWSPLAAEFWRFSTPRAFANFLQTNVQWIGVLLVGRFASTDIAGVYAASTRFLVVGSLVNVAVMHALMPQLSRRLARGEVDDARTLLRTATRWLVLVTWPLYLVLALGSKQLLEILGQEFRGGAAALLIVGLAMLVATGVGPVDTVLLMGGRSWWNLVNVAVALSINVGLTVLLVPRLGLAGAAVGWAAGIVTNNVMPCLQVWIAMRLHAFDRRWLGATSLALACYGPLGLVLGALPAASLVSLVVVGTVATGAYALLAWRWRVPLGLDVFVDLLRPGGKDHAQR